jgi:hypothetical protein
MMTVHCGCARTGERFEALFESGKLVEVRRSVRLTLREKLRDLKSESGTIAVTDLDLGAIRCLNCGTRMFRCGCGIMCCRGKRRGDVYTCVCGNTGTLAPMADNARVSGGENALALGGSAVKAISASRAVAVRR